VQVVLLVALSAYVLDVSQAFSMSRKSDLESPVIERRASSKRAADYYVPGKCLYNFYNCFWKGSHCLYTINLYIMQPTHAYGHLDLYPLLILLLQVVNHIQNR
jgi:hypothetical protein